MSESESAGMRVTDRRAMATIEPGLPAAETPMAMLAAAVQRNASVETLEKLPMAVDREQIARLASTAIERVIAVTKTELAK